jgi:hypothetical protein
VYSQQFVKTALENEGLTEAVLSDEERAVIESAIIKVGSMHRLVTMGFPSTATQTTQTPDEWVRFADERILDRQNDGGSGDAALVFTELPEPEAKATRKTSIVQKNSKRSSFLNLSVNEMNRKDDEDYRMGIGTCCELIAEIYIMKLRELRESTASYDVTSASDLFEATKTFVLNKAGVRRLAVKQIKGMINCCRDHSKSKVRLELFADLCGFMNKGAESAKEHCMRLSFFYRLLNIISPDTSEDTMSIEKVLRSHRTAIAKHIALESLGRIFPRMALYDAELFVNIASEIDELPNLEIKSELPFKVNADDLIFILMDYFEFENNVEAPVSKDFGATSADVQDD